MPLPHSQRTDLYAQVADRFDCKHPERELRRRVIKGGSVAYVRQCKACGQVSNPVKTALALQESAGGAIPAYDAEAEDAWNTRKHAAYKSIEAELDGKVSNEYEEYLQSELWLAKRALVLRRAGKLCEGCLERPPTQVHHLTYQHVGEEFMWELVAVCDECHERAHPTHSDA